MIAVIDYGAGNLFSLRSSLEYIGAKAAVTGDAEDIQKADSIILPGVGAFGVAMKILREKGIDEIIKRQVLSGKPLLGICLGMQLLFERSYEFGKHEGLGLLQGSVVPIGISASLKIPHTGWNSLKIKKTNPLLKFVSEGEFVYFIHSYFVTDCDKSVIATTEYGAELTAAVGDGKVFGAQFHPEKSGETGLNILRAFARIQ